MNKLRWITMIALFSYFIASAYAVDQPEGADRSKAVQPEQRVIRHMVLITVDGLSSKKMTLAHTPNLNGLAAQGVKTTAVGVLPANFPTFAASLLTGADPGIHGFFGSGQQIKTEALPDTVIRYGRTAAYISRTGTVPKGLFRQKGETKVTNYEVDSNNNHTLIDKAIEVFDQKRPYFLGIKLSLNEEKFSDSDKRKTARALSEIDNEAGRFINTLNSYGVFNETLIIVIGNYSIPQTMNSLSGDNSELTVPVIMTGPGLKASVELPPVRITDIVPTAALLSDIHLPPESNGFVLWNALQAGNGFVEENLLLKRVKDLSEENARSTGEIYRLSEQKRLVKVEKENINTEKQNIQKTIESKDEKIENLKLRINLLKIMGVVAVVIFGIGYIAEYFYLRKKFLMF